MAAATAVAEEVLDDDDEGEDGAGEAESEDAERSVNDEEQEVDVDVEECSSVEETSATSVADEHVSHKFDGDVERRHRRRTSCNSDELRDVECHLETKELWDKFNDLGTEMIITKTGRYVLVSLTVEFLDKNKFTLYLGEIVKREIELWPQGDHRVCKTDFRGSIFGFQYWHSRSLV